MLPADGLGHANLPRHVECLHQLPPAAALASAKPPLDHLDETKLDCGALLLNGVQCVCWQLQEGPQRVPVNNHLQLLEKACKVTGSQLGQICWKI